MPRSVRPFEGGSYIGAGPGNAGRRKSIPGGRRRGIDVDRGRFISETTRRRKSRFLRKPKVVEARDKLLRDTQGAFGGGLLREVLQTLPAR